MMLYILDGVVFDVLPTNVHEVDSTAGHEWAQKPLVGAMPRAEAMGPAPREVKLVGRFLPHKFGAGGLGALKAMAESGSPHMLIRGDGAVLGWHAIRHFRERHTYLDATGLGRVVEFDLDLVSTPDAPSAGAMMSLLQGLF